jgi:threonine dehydrogenase-like Zn-dependent dehydrogenase
MKTMVLDVSVPRVVVTRLLGRVWRGACTGPIAPLHLVEMPDPPLPGPGWVRVRNRLCGICGSDLHQIYLDVDLSVAPAALPSSRRIYLGHEMVGDIVEVAGEVEGLAVGDRVVRWGRADDCRARGRQELCPACQRGHRVLCQCACEPRDQVPVGGGYGDSFVTPASTLLPVPAGLADEEAIFAEPGAVAIHAAWRRRPRPGERVLVLGSGPIGFLLLQVLRVLAPDCQVVAVAEFPWQAEMARNYGAGQVFLAADDGDAQVARLTGARLYAGRGGNRMLLGGFDLIYDVVGTEGTLNHSLRWARAGGTVVLVGAHLRRMRLDVTPVWYQEVDLLGSVGHDLVVWEGEELSTFALAMRWMAEGRLDCRALLTHTFPLEAYRQAFAVAADKGRYRSVKVALAMGEPASRGGNSTGRSTG